MTPDGVSTAPLDQVGRAEELVKLLDPETPTPDWLLEELRWAWQAAQGEAASAYEHWLHCPGAEAYTAYRACQDRADTAQDVLGVAAAAATV